MLATTLERHRTIGVWALIRSVVERVEEKSGT